MDRAGGYVENPFTAEFYDYMVPYRERQDVAFFVEFARMQGGPVLELGCGTGRVLIPTARAGLEIVGLDASPAMLAVCRHKLEQELPEVQRRVQLVHGDMRQFDLGREFRLITIPFRPFQHLTNVEDQLACLAGVRRHLIQQGWFILDLFNPSLPRLVDERYLEEMDEADFATPDGRRVRQRSRTVARDLFRQVLDIEMIYYVTHPDGRQERLVHRFPFRYLFRYEVEHLLVRSGFTVAHIYADYDKSPYGSKHPGELIVLARRT